MEEEQGSPPATVPAQPEATAPMKKGRPVLYVLVGGIVLIGITNLSSLINGNKKELPKSLLRIRPAAPNASQIKSFQTLQALEAARDQEERLRQQEVAATQLQQLQAEQAPGPEADRSAPMTAAQRAAIYGDSPNAPRQTSNASEAQAEAKQRALAREKRQQDALNSDTVAIDFAPQGTALPRETATVQDAGGDARDARGHGRGDGGDEASTPTGGAVPASARQVKPESEGKARTNPMVAYDFDEYQGRLYRVFEGTVLEGVVTNRIDGGLSGPILLMLTTDTYSHDHQQLLMPQGTRLIGSVESVGSAQQRKMFVTFHRAVCPDGFSLDFDKYIGLDPLGTTGLATKIDHGYLLAFGAAAALGGLGGLAQMGNNGSVLSPSTQIRTGISQQSAQEGEQVLSHFLNRLPVITLKEGSRARVYIGRDILVPSYAEHRVDPHSLTDPSLSVPGGFMNMDVKKHCKYLIAGGLLLLTATPSFALFGFGDIVFDPTSYASLLSQARTSLSQLRTQQLTYANALNQLKTMEQTYRTAMTELNTIEASLKHFSSKSLWATMETAMKPANVKSLFGETSGMTTALNTNSPATSTRAWSMSNLPVSGSAAAYLKTEAVGNSAQLSQLAMIEASDSISPDCLTAIGQYRAARTANAAANINLAQQQLDGSDGTNSEVEQLNLLNAAEAQKLSEMQTQGVLHACLASQMTVANMQQRNAAAEDLNTAGFVQQRRVANPTNATNESQTWQTYLP